MTNQLVIDIAGGAAWMPLLLCFSWSFCEVKTPKLKNRKDAIFQQGERASLNFAIFCYAEILSLTNKIS